MDLIDLVLLYWCLGVALACVELIGVLLAFNRPGTRIYREWREAVRESDSEVLPRWVLAAVAAMGLAVNFAETALLWPVCAPSIFSCYWSKP